MGQNFKRKNGKALLTCGHTQWHALSCPGIPPLQSVLPALLERFSFFQMVLMHSLAELWTWFYIWYHLSHQLSFIPSYAFAMPGVPKGIGFVGVRREGLHCADKSALVLRSQDLQDSSGWAALPGHLLSCPATPFLPPFLIKADLTRLCAAKL